jgi:RND superfamily putative drug exporter
VAVGYVMIDTYVLLFLLIGALVLPLKALLMNLLSISASFGALVWIVRDGHLSGQLNFTPQQIDPTNLVLLFCVVFGLSMDYEVFLLTRIQEQYRPSSIQCGAREQGRGSRRWLRRSAASGRGATR